MMALGGCATSTLKVSSLPEGADVSIVAPDRAPVKIGKTPLEIESRNYPELFQDSVQVQVAKDGHSPLTVLVPRLPNGGTGRINLNLQQSELPKVCQNQSDSINLLAKGIADSASLVQRKKMDEAVRLLEDLSSKFGTVPVVHDLLGNVYYLQRNMDRALDSYRRSNKLNPNNIDTIRMIERIEQLQGRGSAGV
jgi:tetratricopeptide (TPR) repeat protein